jgi:hypothetical protein
MGRMSEADAILDRMVMKVSPRGHLTRGWSCNAMRTAIIAPGLT